MSMLIFILLVLGGVAVTAYVLAPDPDEDAESSSSSV